MAIDHLMSETGQQYGDLLILDDGVQRSLCVYCLIEEAAIEIMLDETLRRFPHLLSFQREWGIFIALARQLQMADFV
jgi:hypothetical protein